MKNILSRIIIICIACKLIWAEYHYEDNNIQILAYNNTDSQNLNNSNNNNT
jgi:hypothetical protein